MPKRAISVTLRDDNLVWLRGRSRAARHRSVSETLDRLIADARSGGRGAAGSSRSVGGTIRILGSDPSLARADAVIRALFRGGPVVAGKPPARQSQARRRPRRQGG
jgi:hypothetical protein